MTLAIFLLLLSVGGFSVLNLVVKLAVTRGIHSTLLIFGMFTLAGLLMLAIAAGRGELASGAWWVLPLGAIGGAAGAASVNFAAKAYLIGHFGFTTASIAISSFTPALFAVIAYNAPFGGAEITGLALLTVALVLLAIATRQATPQAGRTGYRRWIILLILIMSLNGFLGIAQTIFDHQHVPQTFLFLAGVYLGGTLLFAPAMFKEIRIVIADRPTRKWSLLAALSSSVGMIGCQVALRTLSPVIVFPVVLAAPVFVSLVLSRLLFKESISPAGYLGIILALAGVLLLSGVAG